MNLKTITDFLGVTNNKAESPQPPIKPKFELEKEGEKKILLEWETVSRSEKKGFEGRFTRTWFIILIVISLLLLLMQEFALILAIGSMIFIYYALSKAPIESVKIIVTNHGVSYGDQFYYWNELRHFFFVTKDGHTMLLVDTLEKLPGRLFMILNNIDTEKVKDVFLTYIPFLEKEPTTFADRAFKSVVGRLNFDQK